LGTTPQPVDALIREIREVDRIINDKVAATPIFVYSCPSIEWESCDLEYLFVCGPLHYGEASLLLWTQLSPVDLISV
jgi:hypothetical protein